LTKGGRDFLCGPKYRKLTLPEQHQWHAVEIQEVEPSPNQHAT